MRKTVSFTVKVKETLFTGYDLFSGEIMTMAGDVMSEGGGRGLLMRG
jgi:hypothetical protein